MTNLEYWEHQKKHFKNHIATFSDYGNIKILDFKNPNSNEYRIRFLFEEDYYTLHITGDLGELIASNYNNMTYEKFRDFVNSTGYFEQKINCMSRFVYTYDICKAKEDLRKLISEAEIEDEILEDYYDIDDFLDISLEFFSDTTGMDSYGYNNFGKYYADFFEEVEYVGREETGILELYMLAFKLATQQLKNGKRSKKE